MKGSAVRPAAKGYDIAAQINEGGGYIPGYEIFFYFITDKAFGNEPQFNPGFGVGKADFISLYFHKTIVHMQKSAVNGFCFGNNLLIIGAEIPELRQSAHSGVNKAVGESGIVQGSMEQCQRIFADRHVPAAAVVDIPDIAAFHIRTEEIFIVLCQRHALLQNLF